MIRQEMGSDPASVAYDTLRSAVANGADVVLIDTAGRLHNKVGLMNELTKIRNVMAKVIPGAPHEVMLVLDGSTGQNAFEAGPAVHAGHAGHVAGDHQARRYGQGRRGDRYQRPVPYSGALHRRGRAHRPVAALRPPCVRRGALRRRDEIRVHRMKKINVITLGCSEEYGRFGAPDGAIGCGGLYRRGGQRPYGCPCGSGQHLRLHRRRQAGVDRRMILRCRGQAGRSGSTGCSSWDVFRSGMPTSCAPNCPEVDEFFGVKDWEGVVQALGGEWRSDLATERRLTTPRHYAYLKIGEGATGSAVTAPFRSSAGRTSRCRWSRCSTRRGGWPPAACAN